MLKHIILLSLLIILIQTSLFAQQLTLVVEWESQPGQRVGNILETLSVSNDNSSSKYDFNNDGIDDMLGFYDASSPYIALIINGANPAETWQIELPSDFDPNNHKFIGFYEYMKIPDIPGESQKQVVFGKRSGKSFQDLIVTKVDGSSQSFGALVLIDIEDLDQDGLYELLLGDKTNRILQIWGAGN